MVESIKVEFVIRDYQGSSVVRDMLANEFCDIEVVQKFDDKLILNVEPDWGGFKSGLFQSMLRDLGESLYVAIAYFTRGNEIVVDFDGTPVDSFSVVVGGVKYRKYVKKKLKIINVLDAANGAFEAKAYSINTGIVPPFEKIMDLFVACPESGFTLSGLTGVGNDSEGNR